LAGVEQGSGDGAADAAGDSGDGVHRALLFGSPAFYDATALAGTLIAPAWPASAWRRLIGVQALIGRGDLVDLFPDWPGETFPLYALYPSRHLPAAKVRAFIATPDRRPERDEEKCQAVFRPRPALTLRNRSR
jgi:DNA-binding transcriptional LysR family regulator